MDKSLKFISDYASSLEYKDLPKSTVQWAKMMLIDSIGCALNAYALAPGKAARRLCYPVSGEGGYSARVIGSLQRTSPDMAAFANSTMVRDLDFNDVFRALVPLHPSDTIPAVLAAAEAVHADGKRLIEGIVLGYEIQVPFAERTPIKRVWDFIALPDCLGSAVGAGKILGLSKEQFANAAALAVLPNNVLEMRGEGELSMYKEVYAGMAARQGLFAALMAQAGMDGPEETFEGVHGFVKVVMDGQAIGWEPLGGKGVQFMIERTTIKRFPVRGQIQLFAWAALELREKVRVEEIESLVVKTHATGASTAKDPAQWAPKTRETADHSSPVAVAIGLLDGDVTPEHWIRKRFLDKDVLSLISKMKVVEDPEITKEFPAKNQCRIEAKTKSGKTVVAHQVAGSPTASVKWDKEMLEAKYLTCVRGALTPEEARASLDLMWQLEELDDSARILDHLRI